MKTIQVGSNPIEAKGHLWIGLEDQSIQQFQLGDIHKTLVSGWYDRNGGRLSSAIDMNRGGIADLKYHAPIICTEVN